MKIATRSSKLALAQVQIFKDALNNQKLDFEIKTQITEGDRKSAEGKNLFDKAHFVEDIEDSLLSKEADIAVHSLKDMASTDRDGLEIFAAIPHPSRGDVLVYKDSSVIKDLTKIHIGTSSLRRKRQCKFFLNNKNCSEIRGNIDTRLEKLHQDKYDAIILAKAGIERLDIQENYIDLDFLPAIGQGIIAIQCRTDDFETKNKLTGIRDEQIMKVIELERYVVRELGATCSSALSIQANVTNEDFNIDLEIYGRDSLINKTVTGKYENHRATINEFINEIIVERGLELLNENN